MAVCENKNTKIAKSEDPQNSSVYSTYVFVYLGMHLCIDLVVFMMYSPTNINVLYHKLVA